MNGTLDARVSEAKFSGREIREIGGIRK